MVRRGNDHRVDLIREFLVHFAVVGVMLRAFVNFSGHSEAAGVHIAKGVNVFASHVRHGLTGLAPNADEREVQLFVRVFRLTESRHGDVRGGERQRALLQERTAGKVHDFLLGLG